MQGITEPVKVVNHLIDNLPEQACRKFLQNCEPVDLVFGMHLCESGRPYKHVYFPLTGFVSMVTTLSAHPPLEMGLIGNEGMLGVTMVLGVNVAPMCAVVQGAGTALQMTAVQFQREVQEIPTLLPMLNRYLYVMMAQLSQTAACTHFHEIEPRLARWLLMSHDRAHADHFHLTHEFLADMLGVRRSGITIAAGALQMRHLIHYTRGKITILDRKGLEAASCKCYKVVVDEYDKWLK